jgi:hypothetical protein
MRVRILSMKCIILTVMALAGCGGGGGSSALPVGSAGSVNSGTVAKSVVGTSGQQITVSNSTYTATGATTVTLNGAPATPVDVQPGMQVTITREGASDAVASIEIEGELEGMIEQIDPASGQFTVMGQTVVVSDQTVFSGVAGVIGLTAGRIVEVHGLPNDSGMVAATRVEVKPATRSVYISGPIANLDSARKTFGIRAVTVDFTTATLPAPPLADGLFVKVKGTFANGVLTATGIRVRRAHPDHGHVELEGVVDGYNAAGGTFTVHGRQIQLTASTLYQHGVAGDMANGVKVEVKGTVTNGVITATTVEIDVRHGVTTHGPLGVAPPLPGKLVYDTSCTGCHRLGSYDTTGSAPDLSGRGALVSGKLTGGHKGITLNAPQVSDLTAFIATK